MIYIVFLCIHLSTLMEKIYAHVRLEENMATLHVALIIRGSKLQLFTQNWPFTIIRGSVKLEELR